MNTTNTLRTACGAAALMLPLLAGAATVDRAEARTLFNADSRACQASTDKGTLQRSACLRDARSAYQTRLAGGLDDGTTPADWARNALLRCNVHKDATDREGCERMAHGEGTRVGSVETGAVLVQLTLQVQEPTVTAELPAARP